MSVKMFTSTQILNFFSEYTRTSSTKQTISLFLGKLQLFHSTVLTISLSILANPLISIATWWCVS